MTSPTITNPPAGLSDRPLEDWTSELLEPLMGDRFAVMADGHETGYLDLLSVSSSREPAIPGGRIPFSLIFRSAGKDTYFPQGCHSLHHPALGHAVLFLVPIGLDDAGMLHEAVFS